MKHLYKIAALLLALMMFATGCGVNTKNYATTPAATYGDQVTYMDEANFWLRSSQWVYEANYAYTYYIYYGITDIWPEKSGRGTQTMAQTMREDVMAQILQSYILKDHAAEYNVAITPEDEDKIDKAVASLHDELADEFFELCGNISDERLKEIHKDRSLAVKVLDAVRKEAVTDVKDEDCKSFTVSYFLVTDAAAGEGDSAEAAAKRIFDKLESGTEFSECKSLFPDFTTNTLSYVRNTENADGIVPFQVGKDLAAGENAIQEKEGTGWYVIHCDSDDDKDAAAEKRAALEDAQRDEHFNEVYAEWKKDAKEFKVSKAFNKLKMTACFVEKSVEAAN